MARDLLNSFVLTPHFGIPTPDDVRREVKAMHCKTPFTGARETNGLVCDAGNLRVLIVPMRGVVPADEVAAGFRRSSSRFFDFGPPDEHEAHVAVTSSCKKGQVGIAELELHNTIVAAVANILDATGISSAAVTHPAEYFIGNVEQEFPFTPLWCGVSLARAARPTDLSFLTVGLNTLGLREIEVVCAEAEREEGVSWVLDFAGYIAELGRNLEDGETFGRDDAERRTISLVPSPVEADKRVCRLDLTSPA
jgi:Domain of unknown function (DUF4261)